MPLHVPPVKVQADPGNVGRADATGPGMLYDQTVAASIRNLANDNKAKINAVLAILREAGIVR